MIDDLPEGWAESTLGELSVVVGGGTPRAKDPGNFCDSGGHPWLTPADLSGFRGMYVSRGSRNLTQRGLVNSSAKLMPKGTVLMSSRAPIGYLAIAANEICTNQGFKNFICSEALQPEYVFHWLKFINGQLQEMGSGSTFAEISGARAREIPIMVAPLAEQRRIVAKVESLLARVNAARDRLAKVPAILKRFRKSVLAAACSGKLTEDWRALQPTETSATEALAQALQAREMAWLSTVPGRKPSNYEVPPAADGGDEIPDGWVLATGCQIFLWSSGSFLPKAKMKNGSIPVYGGNGLSGHHNVALVTDPTLVIGRVGAQCGNVHYAEGPAWITDNAIYARWAAPQVNLRFAKILFSLANLNASAGGSGQPYVNQERLDNLRVPFPPPNEQEEIVHRVDALLACGDAIERRIAAATTHVDRLPQSILAKAFRGDLIPTEAEFARREGREFEPASALLERVRMNGEGRKNSRSRGVGRDPGAPRPGGPTLDGTKDLL